MFFNTKSCIYIYMRSVVVTENQFNNLIGEERRYLEEEFLGNDDE